MGAPNGFDKPAPTRDGYGVGLARVGDRDDRIVALDADLAESTRSQWFGHAHPERFFQMGISEQDMVVTAAGLASAGFKPFASTFAIFMERAFEQIRNAVARPNLDVKIVGSHGGLMTGEDGSSAQSIEDVAIYRALPNMRVVVPADPWEAVHATEALAASPGPAYMKLTRQKVPILYSDADAFTLGKAHVLRDGSDITLAACGALVGESLKAADELAADGVSARVINVATIKPLDGATILRAARETGRIVTAEDHTVNGGLGGAIAEILAENKPTLMHRVGVRDTFGESGLPVELYEKYGLTGRHIALAARDLMKSG